ncbi:MAG: iron-containing redox enzyme family protein, partial [Mycobacterium sp.]|nr:iron-containing redox enzyme family protein [Mycobacterium sp.]
ALVTEPAAGLPGLAVLVRQLDQVADPLHDDDFQLALALSYELHFRGLQGVDDSWEWQPDLLWLRAFMESRFEATLRQAVSVEDPGNVEIAAALAQLVQAGAGELSRYLARRATLDQFQSFVAQRSIYHLREADAHTFGIPRLDGRTKSALVEIQTDEYGGGQPGRTHAELFAQLMREIGLSDTYGEFWDDALPEMFAVVNVMSMFALHRRNLAALLGHLAALEMTSTDPNRRYGNGLRRLGFGPAATRFYDEHVEADAVHEQLAAVDLCGSYVAAHPDQRPEVLFGAGACLALDDRFAGALVANWSR